MPARVITINLPEYTLEAEPDYLALGSVVDRRIVESFGDGRYLCRALGKDDHPGLSLDELVAVIVERGTDRYDPDRKGVCHEEFQAYDHDLQAAPFEIRDSHVLLDETYQYPTLFGDAVHDFYEKTLYDRGYRVRVDILTLYDADQLELAPKSDPAAPGVAPRLEQYLYRFRDRDRKPEALVGVVKVLRE
jgi:hypothetical protein